MEEILTAEQVAQILQVHPFTVLKFIKQGKLKASKLGRVYRIRKSDVDSFLDSQVEQSGKNAATTNKRSTAEKKTDEGRKTKKISEDSRTEEPPRTATGDLNPKPEKVKTTILEITKEIETEKAPEREHGANKRTEMNDVDHYVLKLKTTEI